MSLRPPPVATRSPAVSAGAPADQEIRFCRAADGMRLAYAIHGSGPPLVVASCWLEPPAVRLAEPGLAPLPRAARRGSRRSSATTSAGSACPTGPSTTSRSRRASATSRRSSPRAGSSGSRCSAMSGGSAVAMAYAIAHPERVSRLILTARSAASRSRRSGDALAEEETYRSMIRVGWAKEDPVFRRVFTTQLHPRRDRGADALVRRPPAHVDLAGQRRREPDRAPGGRHRGRPAARSPHRRSCSSRVGDRSTTFDNAVTVSVADPRTPASSRSRAATTSCSPTSRPGGCSSTRSRRSSSPSGGAGTPRAPARRPRRCRARELEVLRLAADGRTNERDRRLPRPQRPDRRAAPLERLRQARARRSGGPAAAVAEYLRGSARLTRPTACRPPSGGSRDAPIGCWRGSAGASPPPTVAPSTPAGRHERRSRPCRPRCSPRPRPRSAPTRPPRDRRPTVTATLANGRARLSAGAFNWDADLPAALGGENLAPSPTAYLLGALAGCAVAFLHDTLAPQFDVAIDDVTAVAGCSTDARGLLGIDGAAPDLAELMPPLTISKV